MKILPTKDENCIIIQLSSHYYLAHKEDEDVIRAECNRFSLDDRSLMHIYSSCFLWKLNSYFLIQSYANYLIDNEDFVTKRIEFNKRQLANKLR